MGGSDDSVVPQGLEQHRVLDVAEHPADVVGVRGAGKVRVEGLSLPTLVPGDGLLLVQLADVFFGVLGISSFTWHGGERQEKVSGLSENVPLFGGREDTWDLFRELHPNLLRWLDDSVLNSGPSILQTIQKIVFSIGVNCP